MWFPHGPGGAVPGWPHTSGRSREHKVFEFYYWWSSGAETTMHQSRAEITTPSGGANINTPDLGCFAKFPGQGFCKKI
mgnify:CR=1 FL=1|jgi:hypothetical protein